MGTFGTFVGRGGSLGGASPSAGPIGGSGFFTSGFPSRETQLYNEQTYKEKPSFTIIDPPDDRYMPGYIKVDDQGNMTTVGPRLKDLNVSYSLYGIPIPISYGVRRLPGNIIWAKPLTEKRVKKRQGFSGGKGGGGGGGGDKNVTFEYYATFAVSFGYSKNPDATTRQPIRVWADGNLVSDRRSTSKGKSVNGFKYRFYPGTATQAIDPTIEADLGVGSTPAYRSLMYLVVEDVPVAQFGNRLPALTIEIGDVTAPTATDYNLGAPAGGVSTNELMVDFPSRLAWARAGFPILNQLYEFDLNTGYSRSITITDPKGIDTGEIDATFCYVPWLNLFVAADKNITSYSQRFYVIDQGSGAIIGRFGNVANVSGDVKSGPSDTTYKTEIGVTGLGQVLRMMPLQVESGTLGTETFILVYHRKVASYTGIAVLKLVPPGLTAADTNVGARGQVSWNKMYAGLDPYITPIDASGEWTMCVIDVWSTGSIGGWCPGPLGDGYTSFFYGINGGGGNTHIWRQGIGNGGRTVAYRNGNKLTAGYETDNGLGMMVYYPPEDCIIYGNYGAYPRYAKRPASTPLYTPTAEISFGPTGVDFLLPGSNINGFWQQDLSFGTVSIPSSFVGGNSIVEIDIASFTYTDHPIGTAEGYAGQWVHDSVSRSMIRFNATGSKLLRNYYDGIQASRSTLAGAIRTLAIEAGLDPDTDLDISAEITDLVDGMIITERTSFKDILDRIATIYLLDIVDTGGVLKITKKAQSLSSGSYDFAIGKGELIAAAQDGIVLQSRREEDSVLPRVVEFTYLSQANSYTYTVARVQRPIYPEPTVQSEQTLSVTLPIAIRDAEAKALAMRVLYQGAWSSRVTYAFRLPWKYMYLDPGDVGTIDSGTLSYTVKIKEMVYNTDWTIDAKAVGFFSDEPFDIEADGGAGYDQEIIENLYPRALILDIPLVVPGVDSASPSNYSTIYSVAYPASPTASKWSGAYVQLKTSTSTWEDIGESFDVPVMLSIATPPTNNGATNMYISDAEIVVTPKTGNTNDLTTVTLDELWNGKNAAVVLNATGDCEIFQFREVTDNGDGTFTLTGLIRGQRNTEIFAKRTDSRNPMQIGSTIILLDSDYVIPNSLPVSAKGQVFQFRPAAFNRPEGEQVAQSFTFQARGTSNPPPINPTLDWVGTAGSSNLRVYFSATSRYGIPWDDDSESEFYDDEALDGTHYAISLYTSNTYGTLSTTIDSPTTSKDANNRYYMEITTTQLNAAYGTTFPELIHVGLSRINSRGSTLSLGERTYTLRTPTT